MILWVIAGLLGVATGLRIGWAHVNKQAVVSAAMMLALGSLGFVAALNWQPLTLLVDTLLHWPNISIALSQVALTLCAAALRVRKFRRGEVIFHEGDPGDSLSIVTKGSVKILVTPEDGAEPQRQLARQARRRAPQAGERSGGIQQIEERQQSRSMACVEADSAR